MSENLSGILQTTDEWEATLEDVDGRLYAHIAVFRWSHSVLKDIRRSLAYQIERLGRPFYALLDPDSPSIRLVETIGFHHCGYEGDWRGDICLTYRSNYSPVINGKDLSIGK